MTMDDFEFEVPMEGMDAMPEGLPEAALDVPGPAEDGADALIPQPPEDGDGQGGVEAAPSPEEPPKKKRASRKKLTSRRSLPRRMPTGPWRTAVRRPWQRMPPRWSACPRPTNWTRRPEIILRIPWT